MKRLLHIALLALLAAPSVRAQIPPPPPACGTGSAVGWLEGPDVRAPVFNTGSLFWRDQGSPNTYTDAAGRNQLLAASLWIGAQFEGFLFMAGSMLGPYEFWPGPLDEHGLPPPDCTPYDRIWEIRQSDFRELELNGTVTDRMRDWPAWAGAPVSDGDGDPDNYNLDGGDRPAMVGDRMLWWVMNDRAGDHVASQAIPLQVQVEASAFSFDRRGVLGRSTFYRYRFRRSGLLPFIDAHVGLFVYGGLGDVFDDYAGSDTTVGMGYIYNADNDDSVFGQAPPAVGVGILRGSGPDLPQDHAGPRSLDTRRMTSMVTFGDLCPEQNCNLYPDGRGVGYYNMMRGRWPWGEQVTLDGGRHGDTPVPWMYPGTPPEFWSEANLDGAGTRAVPGDRKMVVATGPFTIVPGQESEVVFAVVTSSGADNYDSVRQLKEDMAFVQSRAADILAPAPAGPDRSLPEQHALAVSRVWPNPASGEAWLAVSLPEPMSTQVEVLDMLGRRVSLPAAGLLDAGIHEVRIDATDLSPGIYAWRVRTGRFTAHGTFVVSR